MKSKTLKKPGKKGTKASKNKKTNGVVGKKRTIFQLKTNPHSEVYLAGSFNSWEENRKKMVDKNGDGEYTAMVYLPKGDHEYKYIINSEWHVDPECPRWVQNDFGTLNSLVTVN